MTAYLEISPGTFTPWLGEPINGIRYPLSVASAWDAPALEALGLVVPATADPVPDGKVVLSTSVERVGDVVQFVHELADAPIPPLSPRQLHMMLVMLDMDEASIEAQIALIPDATDRKLAQAEWRKAQHYERDHPLVSDLAVALEFEATQLDALWIYAADL